MELFILLMLIVLNGVFAMSEIALVTARRARLASRAASGDRSAQAAIKLGKDPTRFLSTIQIGITSIGLLSGIFGESALAGPLARWLGQTTDLAPATASAVAVTVVIAFITYLSIVVGELVPKRLGQINPEGVARLVARPMTLLSVISRPFVALLTFSTRGLLRLLGINPDQHQAVTEEEIQAMIDEGSESGAIVRRQREMLRNIFWLDDRHMASIMLPRSEIVYLDTRFSDEENLRRLTSTEHSHLPVCEGGLDNLLGVLRAKQGISLFHENRFGELRDFLAPPVFVPETLSGLELLERFRQTRMHMAFIIDEYGTLEGLVAVRDLLEIVTGQMNVPTDEAWAIRREDGSWLLDGTIPVLEMKDRLGLRTVPDERKGIYNILSGMIMYMMGKIPREGDRVDWEGWRFEVVDMDGNRIDKVLARPLAEAAPDEAGADPAA